MVDFELKIVTFSKNFEYNIDYNSKTKNRKIDITFFQHIAHLSGKLDHS